MFNYRKILNFIFFGALAGITYTLVYYWLTLNSSLSVFLNSTVSYLIAMPISYCGNRWFTYQSKNKIEFESLRFIIVQILNILITSLLLHITNAIFYTSTVVQIILAFISAPIISFLLFEFWVYRQSTD